MGETKISKLVNDIIHFPRQHLSDLAHVSSLLCAASCLLCAVALLTDVSQVLGGSLRSVDGLLQVR